jgi:plastocyanin domain-containing protein
MMTLLINIIGLLIIALIIWWFWLSRSKAIVMKKNPLIEIHVKDGVYTPPRIQVKTNTPITLRFIRDDASPCAKTVIFSDLNISKALPLHTPIDILLTLPHTGEYEFTCSMGMYRGKLIAT